MSQDGLSLASRTHPVSQQKRSGQAWQQKHTGADWDASPSDSQTSHSPISFWWEKFSPYLSACYSLHFISPPQLTTSDAFENQYLPLSPCHLGSEHTTSLQAPLSEGALRAHPLSGEWGLRSWGRARCNTVRLASYCHRLKPNLCAEQLCIYNIVILGAPVPVSFLKRVGDRTEIRPSLPFRRQIIKKRCHYIYAFESHCRISSIGTLIRSQCGASSFVGIVDKRIRMYHEFFCGALHCWYHEVSEPDPHPLKFPVFDLIFLRHPSHPPGAILPFFTSIKRDPFKLHLITSPINQFQRIIMKFVYSSVMTMVTLGLKNLLGFFLLQHLMFSSSVTALPMDIHIMDQIAMEEIITIKKQTGAELKSNNACGASARISFDRTHFKSFGGSKLIEKLQALKPNVDDLDFFFPASSIDTMFPHSPMTIHSSSASRARDASTDKADPKDAKWKTRSSNASNLPCKCVVSLACIPQTQQWWRLFFKIKKVAKGAVTVGEVLVQSRSPIHQSSFFMPANFLFLLITFYFFGKKLQALIDLLYNVKTVVVNTLCRKNICNPSYRCCQSGQGTSSPGNTELDGVWGSPTQKTGVATPIPTNFTKCQSLGVANPRNSPNYNQRNLDNIYYSAIPQDITFWGNIKILDKKLKKINTKSHLFLIKIGGNDAQTIKIESIKEKYGGKGKEAITQIDVVETVNSKQLAYFASHFEHQGCFHGTCMLKMVLTCADFKLKNYPDVLPKSSFYHPSNMIRSSFNLLKNYYYISFSHPIFLEMIFEFQNTDHNSYQLNFPALIFFLYVMITLRMWIKAFPVSLHQFLNPINPLFFLLVKLANPTATFPQAFLQICQGYCLAPCHHNIRPYFMVTRQTYISQQNGQYRIKTCFTQSKLFLHLTIPQCTFTESYPRACFDMFPP
ncbi:hypothetical protein VP01_1098g1 [Puccinia sorghi]|uniref:Uncharacterized protein n=1 Tax=Puccinia sorghi TaxID=27349 RepID=A0A0L6VUD2_9BASI|nr:hypothetical protein VP01_1098g1 [Puccinia sorghi]